MIWRVKMANKIKLFINILFLTFTFLYASELPEWHMKPIGSHVKPDPVDETKLENVITPEDFATKYVLPRKPLVFRDIAKIWPAYKLWTDEYLTANYGDMEMRLEAKKEKQGMIPKGDICLGRDTLKKFLVDYRQGADKYIVSDLPASMYRDVMVPPPMACGDFLTSFVEVDLWVNSDMGKKGKGGNSIIHKDAFNTINCVLNGTKEWKLFELKYNDMLYQSWEGPMDAGYGGYSLVNPDKVDAAEFPDVGKIPNWQFTTINAGDCIYLPSQMWHQVKSVGETNRAVAFLFSQFNDVEKINTTDCGKSTVHLPLSSVDVDWPYAGKGVMPMGNSQVESVRGALLELVDRKKGHITKRKTYTIVYARHSNGAINKAVILEKATTLYEYMLKIAGGEKKKVTIEMIANMTRDEIRFTYTLLNPIEPHNSYNYEYTVFTPEDIENMIDVVMQAKDKKIERDVFLKVYQDMGGTESFAVSLWDRLAGNKLIVENITESMLAEAIKPYEYYRRDKPETDDTDEDATITTPQGHISQPKRRQGGYSQSEDEDDENENNGDEDEDKDEEEVGRVKNVDTKNEL